MEIPSEVTTAIASALSAAAVYLVHRVRREKKRALETESVDDTPVDMESSESFEARRRALRVQYLVSQIADLVRRLDRMENRLDKHVEEDVDAHERLTRVEEQHANTRKDVDSIQERTERLLSDILSELRVIAKERVG